MESKLYTNKEKIDIATERFLKTLSYIIPPCVMKPKEWINTLIETGDLYGDIFEYVYRAYHRSYKVMYMQSHGLDFIGMIVYLFSKRIKKGFFKNKKYEHYIGFPEVFTKGFLKLKEDKYDYYVKYLDKVFHKKSLTYRHLKDFLSQKPSTTASGWQKWEDTHLELMGGIVFTLVNSLSLLGMLKRYIKKDYRPNSLITYPDGIATYLLYDINFKELNK